MKYKYIAYFGKSEVIVNEQKKPGEYEFYFPMYDGDGGLNYNLALKEWQKSCKTIPIAEGHEGKFMSFAMEEYYHNFKDRQGFKIYLQSGIQIPNELVRFEGFGVFHNGSYMNTCSICKELFVGDKRQPVCEPCCNKETAYFVDKEQETNEAKSGYYVWESGKGDVHILRSSDNKRVATFDHKFKSAIADIARILNNNNP